jgi:hypothetical protein
MAGPTYQKKIQWNPASLHLYTFMEGLSSADMYI